MEPGAGRTSKARVGAVSGSAVAGAGRLGRGDSASGRTILMLVLAWVFRSLLAGAADASTAFDAAAKLYEEGRPAEAVSAYQRLLTNGVVTPAVWFNQGNAWFKAGRIGRAIACYRAAQRLAPRDPEISGNLAFVRSKLPAGTPPPSGTGLPLLSFLTLDEWAWAALVALWLWFGLLVVRSLLPRGREATSSLAWCIGAATILFLAAAAAAWTGSRRGSAVVVVSEATLRFGPLREAQVAFPLPEGSELQVMDRKNDWLQVRDGQGRQAWVQGGDVVAQP